MRPRWAAVLWIVAWLFACEKANAQDVLSLAPPEMEALVEALDRPEGADQLRLGIQFDLEKEVTLLALNFAGTAVFRPAAVSVVREGFRTRPQVALRLRSPVTGSETGAAGRTVTSGGEVSFELAWTAEVRIIGPLWALARVEAAAGIQQAGILHDMPEEEEAPERLLTAGVASVGPRAGLVLGPALLTIDLGWHEVWFGAETFQTFEDVVEDGPFFGVSFVFRFSSHLFAHFRVLPRLDDPLPDSRWTFGIAASFDPIHD
jgi:hypothetical protein